MENKTLKHFDLASKAEFIELPETNYNYSNDSRFQAETSFMHLITGSSTNTIMSQKNPGWDGDSDND